MFALTRLVHFPLILGQVSLNLGKPTLNHLKTVNKAAVTYWDKVCTAQYHKLKRDYSSVITIVNNTDVEEAEVQKNENHVSKGILGKIQTKLKLMYTCKICNTRNTKFFSRLAYEKGIVIVICDCCDSKHLIADNLEWFKDNGTNIEKLLSDKGEIVKRGKVLITEDGAEIDIVQNSTHTC